MKSVIITSIAFLLVFSSCDFARDKVRGNWEIKEESRKETGFSRVQVSEEKKRAEKKAKKG